MSTRADLDFDLDRYLRASGRVDLSAVDWEAISRHPVSGAEARCLAYMMDIESHTVIFLRDLLSTPAAQDPDVTAFLSCWVYEELWHGEAFSRFLGEAGYRLDPDREAVKGDSPFPTKVGRNASIRRALGRSHHLSQIGTMLASRILGEDFVAVHMTWGAVNELSTLTSYHSLIERTEHPVLIELLRAVIKDERRHFAFYRAQARLRLHASPRARKMTRWAMENLWAPVGTGVRPQEETDFVVAALFGDDRGAEHLRDLDETVRELPGFEDANLLTDARSSALERMGPAEVRILSSEQALQRAGLYRVAELNPHSHDVAQRQLSPA